MLIVGLGNPGEEYGMTWHNMGRLAVERLAASHDAKGWSSNARIAGSLSSFKAGGGTVRLMVPERYMNESGLSVASALSFLKLKPKDLVLAHDDLAFPLGTVRIASGKHSAGGHNGVRSVIDALGTDDFARVRIGIAPRDGRRVTMQTYVTGRFPKKELAAVERAIADAAMTLDKIVSLGMAKATQEVNSK